MLSLLHVGFVMKVIRTGVQHFFCVCVLRYCYQHYNPRFCEAQRRADIPWMINHESTLFEGGTRRFLFLSDPLLVLQRLCSVDSLQVTTPVKMKGKNSLFQTMSLYMCV